MCHVLSPEKLSMQQAVQQVEARFAKEMGAEARERRIDRWYPLVAMPKLLLAAACIIYASRRSFAYVVGTLHYMAQHIGIPSYTLAAEECCVSNQARGVGAEINATPYLCYVAV